MGIYSGVQHTFGVGNIEMGLEFFALLFSSNQIVNMKLCAGQQVMFRVFTVANIMVLACALPPPPKLYNVGDATACDLRHRFF